MRRSRRVPAGLSGAGAPGIEPVSSLERPARRSAASARGLYTGRSASSRNRRGPSTPGAPADRRCGSRACRTCAGDRGSGAAGGPPPRAHACTAGAARSHRGGCRPLRRTRIVGSREVLASLELRQHRGDGVDHRNRAARPVLGRVELAVRVTGAHLDRAELEVDVAPAQREELTHAQSGEGRGEVVARPVRSPPSGRAREPPRRSRRRSRRDACAAASPPRRPGCRGDDGRAARARRRRGGWSAAC